MVALDPSHKRWVEGFAAQAHRRLRAAGCSTLQIDDVRQECWIAWCKARDTWQEGGGASFRTYLNNGMALHLRRWMMNQKANARMSAMGENAIAAAEAQADETDFEDAILAREARAGVLRRMTPATRQVLALAVEPPAWLAAEVKAMHDKVRWCRSRGFVTRERPLVSLVMEALGLTPVERKRVTAEMLRFASVLR